MGILNMDKLEEALNAMWVPEDHINEYMSKKAVRKGKVEVVGININNMKVMVKFLKQMYHSGHFDEADLTEWDKKTQAQITYTYAQLFFIEKTRTRCCT